MEEKNVTLGQQIKYLILSILPALGMLAVIFVVSQICQTVILTKYSLSSGVHDPNELLAYITNYLQGDNLLKILAAGQIIVFLLGLLILKKGLKAKAFGNPIKKLGNIKLPGIIVGFVGVELTLSCALITIGNLFPDALKGYSDMISTSGLADLTLISTIATVVLAPICEEVVFRGLTMKILEKTNWKFWVVNALQALLFGIEHLNWVQGIYAFVLGLVLGYVCKKTDSLWGSILAHAVFNASGTWIVSTIFNEGEGEEIKVVKVVVVLVVAIAAAVAGLWMVSKKDREVVTNE